ncbi:phosphoglycerate dehydrogenase (plasmid) [Amycolatopsis sp. FU40]|uniref:NAD(P)-dependent oxidoreductase n=1 Tax=Amycolatopsis sp. FU40 TaxID=2914159 RepID=UPI001F3A3052|nr:NAD(P)-dependent oxidoreductase [Amycolatopsis sp. FU40]UKD50731.1 phosphoglycerate dehydrogenase [Amycolatopsis sp. FU40]
MKALVSQETHDEIGRRLLAAVPGIEVLPYDPAAAELTPEQRTAEVLVPPYSRSHRPRRLVPQLPELRMVQLLSAGADEWQGDVPAEVLLASARGAHARPVAEWVLSAILTTLRQWPALVRAQDEHLWAHRRFELDTLADKRLLVLGAGSIGTAAADLARAFGAQPTLVARSARPGVRAVADLPDLLGEHSILVITAPLTDATDRLVDAGVLAALPDGALVVNAGRGRIVDTEALVAEVKTGRLRAALDVTDPEPLPADHPLWTLPGVIISPHSARTVPGTEELCYRVAAEQIGMMLAGQTPTNAVTARR